MDTAMMVEVVIRTHWGIGMGGGMALLIPLKKQKKKHKRRAGQSKYIVHEIIRKINAKNKNVWWSSEGDRIFI